MSSLNKITLVGFLLLFNLKVFAQHCGPCPKRKIFNFRLLKKEGINLDTSRVRIDGVYLFENQNKYSFIRFFDNGRVYQSNLYCSMPDSTQLDEFKCGSYGYYRVDSNTIKTETFLSRTGYYFAFFEIGNKSIAYSKTSARKWRGNLQIQNAPYLRYCFYPCKLTSVSFW